MDADRAVAVALAQDRARQAMIDAEVARQQFLWEQLQKAAATPVVRNPNLTPTPTPKQQSIGPRG